MNKFYRLTSILLVMVMLAGIAPVYAQEVPGNTDGGEGVTYAARLYLPAIHGYEPPPPTPTPAPTPTPTPTPTPVVRLKAMYYDLTTSAVSAAGTTSTCLSALPPYQGAMASQVGVQAAEARADICLGRGRYPVLVAEENGRATNLVGGWDQGEIMWGTGDDAQLRDVTVLTPDIVRFVGGNFTNPNAGPANLPDNGVVKFVLLPDVTKLDSTVADSVSAAEALESAKVLEAAVAAGQPLDISQVQQLDRVVVMWFLMALADYVEKYGADAISLEIPSRAIVLNETGTSTKSLISCGTPPEDTEPALPVGPAAVGGPLGFGSVTAAWKVLWTGDSRIPEFASMAICMGQHQYIPLMHLMSWPEYAGLRQELKDKGFDWENPNWFQVLEPQPEYVYAVSWAAVGGSIIYVTLKITEGVATAATSFLIVPEEAIRCFIEGPYNVCEVSSWQ